MNIYFDADCVLQMDITSMLCGTVMFEIVDLKAMFRYVYEYLHT